MEFSVNHPIIFIIVGIIVAFVLGQSIFFLVRALRRAKELGDYLIVALSTDEFSAKEKNKKCYFDYDQRKMLLESLRYVDLVIPEESWEQKVRDVHEFRVDTFVIGDDWEGKFDFLENEDVDVVYLPRTPEISTEKIKHILKDN